MFSFLVKRYIYAFLIKRYVGHNVHQSLFRTRFFLLTKFSMPNNVSHMNAHRIYYITVLRLLSVCLT